MRILLRIADRLEAITRVSLKLASWMMVLMVLAIVVEVLTRRARLEFPVLTSVRLAELQWHFHVILFMLSLGYAYLTNSHVRIDMAVSGRGPRERAWLELVGLAMLFFPFVIMLTYWGYIFWLASYNFNEASDNPAGLPHRWLIKPVLPIGAGILLLAGIANALRLITFLFGPPDLRAEAKPVTA